MSVWLDPVGDITLEQGDIHIWLSYLNLHEARLKHLYPLLSNEEKQRSERFHAFKHRKRFIASHGFMRSVLAQYLDCSGETLQFKQKEHGKPELVLNKNQPDLHFNLSHSNNLALLAVRHTHELGVDVEFTDKKIEWKKIIKRFYTETEQKTIFALATDELQRQAFFQVWTRKEAHMKVTGQGLHLSPTQFSVTVPPAQAKFMTYTDAEKNKIPDLIHHADWYMQDIFMPDAYGEYCGCVSSDAEFENISQFVFI